MIRQFPKNHDEPLSADFRLKEFHCRCDRPDCQVTYISEELVNGLQIIRNDLGPLLIDSAFRCVVHNREVGGKPDSKHLLGIAADVRHYRLPAIEIRIAALEIEVFEQGGIGEYKDFVHLDVRGTSARWQG